MADAVASQTLLDTNTHVVMKFTNTSDGTGESAVLKVDVSALSPPCTSVAIEEIWYNLGYMSVKILWDATTDVVAWDLSSSGAFAFAFGGYLDFRPFGGLTNNAGSGVTGDVLFTTVAHGNSDTYSIILKCRKVF